MVRRSMIPWKRDDKKDNLTPYLEDPFWQMRKRMNRYLNTFWENPVGMDLYDEDDTILPRIDLSETDEEYTVVVDLPGLEEKDIDVSYNRNVLSISGKKDEEKEEKGRQYHRVERYSGQFRRTISLQDDVDENNIEANFKNGVLTVNIPKLPIPSQKKKKISIVKK